MNWYNATNAPLIDFVIYYFNDLNPGPVHAAALVPEHFAAIH